MMKRQINSLIILGTIILVGCQRTLNLSGEGVDPSSGSYIFFDTGVTLTKGELVEGEDLPLSSGTAFGVYGVRPNGYLIFDSYDNGIANVYRESEGGEFVYDNLELWHLDDHSFYAYYPNYNSQISLGTSSDVPYIAYTQPTNLSDMVDVMTSINVLSKTTDGFVNLQFDHRLFAFEIVLINAQSESMRDVELTGFKVELADVNSTAKFFFTDENGDSVLDYTVDNPTTFIYENSQQVTVSPMTDVATPVECRLSEPFLLLPCSSLKIKVTVNITTAWGEAKEYVCEHMTDETALAPGGGFLAGYRYRLNVIKNDKSVEFAIENTALPWSANEDIGIDFY